MDARSFGPKTSGSCEATIDRAFDRSEYVRTVVPGNTRSLVYRTSILVRVLDVRLILDVAAPPDSID
jgi:hypothetical protein